MKQLDDGTIVPSRTWYYLLDWNDRDNFKYMTNIGKKGLKTLTVMEYVTLFKHATRQDTIIITPIDKLTQ